MATLTKRPHAALDLALTDSERPMRAMLPLVRLVVLLALLLSPSGASLASATLPGRTGVSKPAPLGHAARRRLVCSTIWSSISPCDVKKTVAPGTRYMQTFTVKNLQTRDTQIYKIHCSTSGVVSSCSYSPTSLTVSPNSSRTIMLTYTIGSSAGSGTVSATASGGWGPAVTGTITATLPAVYRVEVFPVVDTIIGEPLGVDTVTFLLHNTGNASAVFNLTPRCSGGVSACRAPARVGPVAAGAWATATVTYRHGPAGTSGEVGLSVTVATDSAKTDSSSAQLQGP